MINKPATESTFVQESQESEELLFSDQNCKSDGFSSLL